MKIDVRLASRAELDMFRRSVTWILRMGLERHVNGLEKLYHRFISKNPTLKFPQML